MNRTILRSEKNKGFYYYLIIFGGFFLIFLSLTKFFPINAKANVDSWELISCIFLGLLGIIFLYYILSIDIIEVYVDRLKILSFYGRTKKIILRNEIVKWSEAIKYSKYGHFKTLTIFTNNSKYKINESSYINYARLRNEVTKGKLRATELEGYIGSSQSKFDTLVIIIGLLFLLSLFIYQQISK